MERPNGLGETPVVESVDGLNLVLRELGHWDAVESTAKAARDEAIAAAKEAFEAAGRVRVGRIVTTIAERREALTIAATEWAGEHLSEHLPKGKKSLALTYGTAKLRSLPEIAEPGEGEDDRTIADRIDEFSDLKKLIDELHRMPVTVGENLRLDDLGTVTFKPSAKLILTAYQKGRLDEPGLAGIGLFLRPKHDEITLEPSALKTDPVAA